VLCRDEAPKVALGARPKRARSASLYFAVEQYKQRRAAGGLILTFLELKPALMQAFQELPEARQAPYAALASADAARFATEMEAWRQTQAGRSGLTKRKRSAKARVIDSSEEEASEKETDEDDDNEDVEVTCAEISRDHVAAVAAAAAADPPPLQTDRQAAASESITPAAGWKAAGSLLRLRVGPVAAQTPAITAVERAPTPTAPPRMVPATGVAGTALRMSRGLGSTPRVQPSATPAPARVSARTAFAREAEKAKAVHPRRLSAFSSIWLVP